MKWTAWRLWRAPFFVFAAITIALVPAMQWHAAHYAALYREWQGHCLTSSSTLCLEVNNEMSQYDGYIRVLHLAPIVVSLIAALVLGATAIASEINQGTARLALTQSCSRRRWLTTKLLMGLGLVAVIGAVNAASTYWWLRVSQFTPRIGPTVVWTTGIAAVAAVLFVYLLGFVAGMVVRRPAWTFAAAAVLGVAVLYGTQGELASSLVPITQTTFVEETIHHANGTSSWVFTGEVPASAWTIDENVYVPLHWHGKVPTWPQEIKWSQAIETTCNGTAVNLGDACEHKAGFKQANFYIVDGQFWPLQERETVLYIVASGLLVAGAFAWLRRLRV